MTPINAAAKVSKLSAHADDIAGQVRAGLSLQPKRLPPKFFYDARGSALFEQICQLPEYYLTRIELAILREHVGEIAQAIGPRPLLVEYGSGSGIKTRLLLDALVDPVGYVPVEISRSALTASVASLATSFPKVEMLPVCADFTEPVTLPVPKRQQESVAVFFPGSTLGNFETDQALDLLRQMRAEMGATGAALIGIDLKKDTATIEAAYNDRAGVTAQFTLNLLVRLNRELHANFDLGQFRHRAIYNADAGRIETFIVSQRDQDVDIDGYRVHFDAAEQMQVEYSYKYSQQDFARMAADAGLRVSRIWTDPAHMFAIALLRWAPLAD